MVFAQNSCTVSVHRSKLKDTHHDGGVGYGWGTIACNWWVCLGMQVLIVWVFNSLSSGHCPLISMCPSRPQNVDLVKLWFKKVTQNSLGDIKSKFVFRLIGPLMR